MYEAIPTLRSTEMIDDTGQTVIQVPLGASMTDSIASTVYDLIFNTAPVFTVRGSPGWESNAYAFQLLANKLVEDEFVNFRGATNEVVLDTVMLGTGAYYVVSTKEMIKRATYEEINTGPRIFAVPPEDLVVPGGTFPNADDMQLIGYRNYFFEAELIDIAKANNWDISNFMVAGNIEWVRQRRVEAARTDVDLQIVGGIYEVFYVHCQYDYNEDGFAEDLFAVWDRTSYEVGFVSYAPYDCRPFVISRYQQRPHIFYGMGVMEMARPFEREVTEWHNFKMQNAHLANARVWAYKLGAVGIGEELKISPNKSIGLGNPADDLKALVMNEMYPSAQQYEAATIALAEMRVGAPASGPISGNRGVQSGKRVPAATAMTAIQQQNKRFAAPFDNIRRACAGAITQCFMRMREAYTRGGDDQARLMEYLVYTVGVKHASLIEAVFKESRSTEMRDKIICEVTATSQSINRQADKQNAMERMQVMGAYYDKAMSLGQIILNDQTPPPLKKLAIDVANGATEAIRAFLRAFDDVRDPDVFIPQIYRDIESGTKSGQGAQEGGQPPADANNPQEQPGDAAPPAGMGGGTNAPTPEPLEGSAELGSGAADTGVLG